MPHFAELRRELETYLDSAAIEPIHKAYRFAADAHKGQQRKSGDPFIVHPLAVAAILASRRMDAQSITAAILHDVIEDTPIEKSVIVEEFGQEVADLVDGVSKLTKIEFESRAEAQAENFRKMLLAMTKDIRVILIKLADRLHNMRTIDVLSSEKRQRIAQETLEIYAPIAKRLGMHVLRVELEDLCFAAQHPWRYRILQEFLQKFKRKNKKNISRIETDIKTALEKNKLPPSAVWVRERHLLSVYKEMHEKGLSFSEIMENYTFCVIVDTVDTCYRALGAIHGFYKPLPDRFRDYIALPKANGYQSLHTTLFGPFGVPVEVQIRTVEMDNLADSGIVTHWQNSEEPNPAHLRAREWMGRLLDIQQSTGNALEFIENVKVDLFPDEVYVFTPGGDILELPRGATPVDFAYAIHSDVGDRTVAVRIDRRIAPLSALLANGQTIEIITEPSAKPNPAWLNFVVTAHARGRIRHYLKGQHHTEAVTFGRRLLETALATLKSNWSAIPDEQVKAVLQQFQYKTLDTLLEAIGLGNQTATLIARHLTKTTESITTHLVQSMIVKGTEGALVNFAECCRPIPNDAVIGILTAGHGIVVHRDRCSAVAKQRKHQDRFISVFWGEKIETSFKVDVHIDVANQPGVLAQLAGEVARAKANIDNVIVDQDNGEHCVVHLTLSVMNRIHLAQVIKRLRGVQAVSKVIRGI